MTCARLPRTTPKGFSTDGAVSGEPSSLGLSRVVTEEDEVNAMEPGTVLPIHKGSTVFRQVRQPKRMFEELMEGRTKEHIGGSTKKTD